MRRTRAAAVGARKRSTPPARPIAIPDMASLRCLLLACVVSTRHASAYPTYWVNGYSQDGGGCGVLVSERTSNRGMAGQGCVLE